GTIAENELDVCASVGFDLVSEDASIPANNLSRIWQSSPAGEEDWTDIEGATSPVHFLEEGIEEETDFRYKVQCNEDDPEYSDIITTTILPGEECYCVPTTGSNTGPINNVTITGDIGEDIENLNTGVGESDNGYSDYADQSVKVTASQDLSFEIDIEGDFISVGLRIWVDWNNDGSFSNDDEVVYQTDN